MTVSIKFFLKRSGLFLFFFSLLIKILVLTSSQKLIDECFTDALAGLFSVIGENIKINIKINELN